MAEMSVVIPARNEMFMANTIQNVLENIEGDTEIIGILDGLWADPPIPDDPRVKLIYHSKPIGQRAATNEGVRYSQAKFIMKLDAHCAVDKGFDVKLMADCEPDWTVIPRMYNLHAFDWQCKKCGNRTYQGPYPKKCDKCDNTTEFERVMVWKPRLSRKTDFARFDRDLHFQYWGDFQRRPESQGDIADVMCCVGAGWMMRRDRYWEIGGMDERHGSWGQMGVELACKSWLSGGRQVVNKKTWFSHMFRTQDGFGFPYKISGSDVSKAREHSRWLWKEDRWEKAKHPFTWLIKKFSPIPTWESSEPTNKTKGIVYYTDSKLDPVIQEAVLQQLRFAFNGNEVISVSLKPMEFGINIVMHMERGYLTMFKQILAGLEKCNTDIVYLVEHDLLYHPSHFSFTPPREDVYYYNENTWKVRTEDGQALFYYCKQTSGLCAYRKLLIEHYRKRVEIVEKNGFNRRMGFEPGMHSPPNGVDNYKAEAYWSEGPNVDIRHNTNLTANRFRQDQFRSQKSCRGWTLSDEVPKWGKTKGRFNEFLKEVVNHGVPK